MRNIILKSFETFIAQPLSILRNKIIRIAMLKSNLTDFKNVSVEIMDDAIQVNVTNSEKVYNLLSAVVYKKKMHELRTPQGGKSEDKASKVFN